VVCGKSDALANSGVGKLSRILAKEEWKLRREGEARKKSSRGVVEEWDLPVALRRVLLADDVKHIFVSLFSGLFSSFSPLPFATSNSPHHLWIFLNKPRVDGCYLSFFPFIILEVFLLKRQPSLHLKLHLSEPHVF